MSTTLSNVAKAVKASSTLAISAKAKALKASGLDIVSFTAGEPDFNTPENIRKAAIDAINAGKSKYTAAAGMPELRAAVSKKFKEFNGLNYEPDQCVVSNGGKQTLHNIFTAIINPGDEVIIPVPFWLSYPEIVRLVGGVPVFVQCDKENDFKLTAEKLRAAVTERTKALVINSPTNPTGAVYTRDELEAIGNVAVEKDFYVVADEMYEILNYTGEKCVSIGSISPEIFAHTITSSGVSKSYAMTGWRIGYSGSSKEIATLISNIQSHQSSNPCTVSQYAALEALNGPQDEIYAMAKVFESRRDLTYGRVSRMPYLDCIEPKGAFYQFVDCSGLIGKKYKDREITSVMDAADILLTDFLVAVIPCADFGMADYIRLSYATSETEITKGLDRIEKFLGELK
ncbi:MAG: pyridoxal phosphate-dependent aminotransferase [Lachnospiraceae bacterium]|nr:pyridoxal phosphate-dependent aminotransferase [Lachnospiraceae bacterium]